MFSSSFLFFLQKSSLTHRFKWVLFNFQVFVIFLLPLCCWFLWDSIRIKEPILPYSDCFKCVKVCLMVHIMVYVGVHFICAWKDVYSAIAGCYACQLVPVDMMIFISFSISLMIFSLAILSISETVVLKFPRIIDFSTSPFSSISFCFMYFKAFLLGFKHTDCYIFLVDWPFYCHAMFSLSWVIHFALEYNYLILI